MLRFCKLKLYLCLLVLAWFKVKPALTYETILDAIRSTSQLSTLAELFSISGLEDPFASPFINATVFAPSNAAFDAALANLDISLEDFTDDLERLTDILLNHIAQGTYHSSNIKDGMMLGTLTVNLANETEFLMTVVLGNGKITVTSAISSAQVTRANIQAGSGVVHVIDGILFPDI
eukprot:TRINITY_DN1290_c0_g1_i1.p4 TRINITY_DN1290_c0_g1~~TRINITY_DN1290_c0_g1_i1.p4  ORF type:complete len:177 (+),score=18.68 TRINITY_DN1290_c0_g1_i1:92-622(+)